MQTLILVAMIALAGPPGAPQLSSAPRLSGSLQRAHMERCLVSILNEVDVPTEEAGRLITLQVKEGDIVAAGHPLGQLDDQQARLSREAAMLERDAALTRANDDIEVRFSRASLNVADAELSQSLEINRKRSGAVTLSEIRRLKLARHRAELQIDRSNLELKVGMMNAKVQEAAVKSADAAIARRRLTAPLPGVVLTTYHEPGEWLDAGEPVVRIVRMDVLRVEGFLSAGHYSPSEIDGKQVMVEVELERGRREKFKGVVSFVSPLVHAGNKYRVRAEVSNRAQGRHWLLRPGMEARMTIDLQ